MDRIGSLCSFIDGCGLFADIGCDHGYCTEYALERGLCGRAIISDISEKSLSKAEKLLKSYVDCGKCIPVCCDGLSGLPEVPDLVLIAGMGGEEIIRILGDAYIPARFIFQPMKNAPSLRKYLLSRGCALTADDLFSDGRNFYFVIKGRLGGQQESYSRLQLEFGRDSLKNPLFKLYAENEIRKKEIYLGGCPSREAGEKLLGDIKLLKEALNYEA